MTSINSVVSHCITPDTTLFTILNFTMSFLCLYVNFCCGNHWKRLIETLPMSTHSKCFLEEFRFFICFCGIKTTATCFLGECKKDSPPIQGYESACHCLSCKQMRSLRFSVSFDLLLFLWPASAIHSCLGSFPLSSLKEPNE